MNEASRHIEPMTNEVPPTPALRDAILRLAAQPDIRSISCPFEDFDLWQGLLAEQAERADRLGLPLWEALCLIGPDTGIPGLTATPSCYDDDDDGLLLAPDLATDHYVPRRWSGDVHIPQEGTCGAELFILPRWHKVFPDALAVPGARLHWLVRKPCNFLLIDRDLGEFACATRSDCAGWFLYKSNAS